MIARLAAVGIALFFLLHVGLAASIVAVGGEAGVNLARMIFYPILFGGTVLSLIAYLRLARSPDGETSVALALNVYVEIAWLILVGVLITIVTRRIFELPMIIPQAVLYGLVAGVASVVLLRGLILVLGAFGRAEWLTYRIRLLPWKRPRR